MRMGAAAAFDSCWEECHEDFVFVERSRSCFSPAASQAAEHQIKIWQQGRIQGESRCAAAVADIVAVIAIVAVAAVAASAAAG